MKNICFFNSTVFWGGGEKLHLEYALKFKNKRYNVVVFSAKGSPLFQKSNEAKLPTEGFKIRNLSFLNPFIIFKIYSFFKSNKIDVVFFSTSQDVKAGGIAAKLAGVPKITYLRSLATPIKKSFINRLILKSITTHIIASSKETARMILKNYSTVIPEHKVKVVYHGIDLKEFDNQKYVKVIEKNKDDIIIGTAGRLTKIKGQTYLLDVARKLKDEGVQFKLYFAGTGELETELKTMVKQFDLIDHVFFLGFIYDVKSFMQDLDIFVFPSLSEGFGLALAEAMALSKAVVAFDISTNPEIIINGQTGFLVNFPDTELFKEKVKLLMSNKVLRLELGKKARLRIEKSFTLDQKVNEIESIVLKTR